MLKHHYAPKKELLFFENEIDLKEIRDNDCFLLFDTYLKDIAQKKQFLLSEKGNFQEAASNLFPLLHQLDDSKHDRIMASSLPEIGLGRAINDRLKKASSNF